MDNGKIPMPSTNNRLGKCIYCGEPVFYLDKKWHHENPETDSDHQAFMLWNCKDCNSIKSWERYPERDHLYEPSNRIFQECYKCRVCGALTWYPVKEGVLV